MDCIVENGMAKITKVYAIDDVNNGIEDVFISKEHAIEAIMERYSEHIPYMKPWTDNNGKTHSVAELVYEDITHLKENGYIEDAYYIIELYLGD